MRWLTITAIAIGLCLLAFSVYVYSPPPVDTQLASHTFAVLPITGLRIGVESVIGMQVPDSKEWKRLVAEWGEPDFIVAVKSGSENTKLCCFPEASLAIRVTDSSGREIPTTPTQAAPYGYISECTVTGVRFSAPPGSELMLHVTQQRPTNGMGRELVVMPYWLYEKDKLVGASIAPYFRRVSIGAAIAGFAFLGISLWSYRRRLRTKQAG